MEDANTTVETSQPDASESPIEALAADYDRPASQIEEAIRCELTRDAA